MKSNNENQFKNRRRRKWVPGGLQMRSVLMTFFVAAAISIFFFQWFIR